MCDMVEAEKEENGFPADNGGIENTDDSIIAEDSISVESAGEKEAETGRLKKAWSKRGVKNKSADADDGAKAGPDKKEKAEVETVEVLKDRLLRLQADFENFRKRVLRDKKDFYQRANEDVMTEMLSVLDHLDLALESARTHDADEAFIKGFELVSEQMLSVLKKFGLSPIDSEQGEFDHNVHEAISRMASAEIPENGIIKSVRKGYMLGDRLLRAAQVLVSSGVAE